MRRSFTLRLSFVRAFIQRPIHWLRIALKIALLPLNQALNPELLIAIAGILALSGWAAISNPASAANRAPSGPDSQTVCDIPLQHLDYSATFFWKGEEKGLRPMRIQIGLTPRHDGGSSKVALISSRDSRGSVPGCYAICATRALERRGSNAAPARLELSCRSEGIAGLNSPAALIWSPDEGSSAIRLGTWAEGYQEAALRVELDSYSPSPMLRQVAARERP